MKLIPWILVEIFEFRICFLVGWGLWSCVVGEEMNDGGGKTTSSLAITEKRTATSTHRPGGCVGIFFQLFDWNRRFARKKLFSKKLLPPVRAKQASKKFKGDEKMPTSKLHLIADENKGGFPNMKKYGNRCSVDSEHNNFETRAPGLVARLMGLESMPATREKPKKLASFSDACDKGERTFVNNNNNSNGGSGREDLSLERASVKLDSRPQKLQKTGQFDRKAVTRFGAESALQLKSVLSRSRKHHHHQHPKFVSPVKSPRISSGKNVSRTSRLIDAATKILEPGLQSTSKAKNALMYSNSVHYHHSNEAMVERAVVKPEEQSKQSGYGSNAAKSLMGQTSCKNCGNLLDVVDCRPNVDEEPSGFPSFVSNIVSGSSSEGTGRSKPRIHVPSFGQEMDPVFQRNWDQPMSLGVQKKEDMDVVQSNSKLFTERKSLPHEGLAPWPSSRQPCTFQSDASTSVNLKQRTQIQEQMPLGRDGTPPRSNSKLSNLESRRVSPAANTVRGSKDFVSLNRNLSGRTRPRVPGTLESSNKLVPEKKVFSGRGESLPPLRSSVRKRRPGNVSSQVECRSFVSSTATKPRNIQCDSMKGKGFGLEAPSMNRACVKSRLVGPTEGNRVAKSNSNDVISFTFNSPIRQKTGTAMEMEKSMDDVINKSCQKPLSLKGDSIAALLEQKLKELTSQEDDEFATGGPPKRSTAMILHELISALAAERPDIASSSTAETKHEGYAGFHHVIDHLSPGSVLEASFSSSSLDGSSGHRLCTDSMDCSSDQLHYSCDRLHYLGPDADLLDSATSLEKELAGCKRVIALISNVSRILDTISIAGGRLTGSTLSHAKDVVMNVELLFGSAELHSLDRLEGLNIGPILLELETSANVAWTNINIFPGADANKGGNQFRGFLFDCLIECLDSQYRKYHYLGFRAWTRLLSCMNRERIIGEVEKEMKKWTSLVGMIPDEIVEWEMSHGLGKWTNFDIEAFESSDEVCGDILQALVNETLIDLVECWQGTF